MGLVTAVALPGPEALRDIGDLEQRPVVKAMLPGRGMSGMSGMARTEGGDHTDRPRVGRSQTRAASVSEGTASSSRRVYSC